jgi:hypothetical protein
LSNLSGRLYGRAILGLFIARLGLLGLASFTAESRTKEIVIQKVLGRLVDFSHPKIGFCLGIERIGLSGQNRYGSLEIFCGRFEIP